MFATVRLVSLLLAAGGLAAALCLFAGFADEEGFFTVRVLVAASGVGAVSLLLYFLVLRPSGNGSGPK